MGYESASTVGRPRASQAARASDPLMSQASPSALWDRSYWGVRLQTLALITILAVGAALRVYVMASYAVAPGDGPLRALMAGWWVQGLRELDTSYVHHPYAGWEFMRLRLSGPWPPGHTVLAGLLILIFHDPLFATRLLSLTLGIASIWVMFYVAKKSFGTSSGIIASAILSTLPLHITLSTNPLTEVPAIFFLLAILAVTFKCTEVGFTVPLLIALSLLTFIATMIRYELWLVVPAIAVAHWQVRRSLSRTCAISAAMSLGPLLWMLSAWIHHGSPVASFGRALPEDTQVGLVPALMLVVDELSTSVGYFIVIAAALGATLCVIDLRGSRIAAMRVAYLTLCFLQLAFLAWFASQRGGSLWHRYVLISSVLILPLATYAYSNYDSIRKYIAIGIIMIGSVFVSFSMDRGTTYIRGSVPDAVVETAGWLQAHLGPHQAFLATRLKGDSHTVGLMTGGTPNNVAYPHHEDEELENLWDGLQPAYIVVLSGEEPGERLLQLFAGRIDSSSPPQEFGPISIYRVKGGGGHPASAPPDG